MFWTPNGLKKWTEVRISLQPYWQIDNGFTTIKPGQAYPARFQIPNLKFLATIPEVFISCRLHEWIKLNSMCYLSGQRAVFDRFVCRLKFCPTRPLLSEKMSHRKFTDHTRLKVERRLPKHKRMWETKALLSSKNATLTIRKVCYPTVNLKTRIFSPISSVDITWPKILYLVRLAYASKSNFSGA